MASLPPIGFCQCGCGAKTGIATQTVAKYGYVRGVPYRFVAGHGGVQSRPPSREIIVEGETCRTIPTTKGQEAIVSLEDYERLHHFRYFAKKQKNKWYAYRTVPRSEGKKNVTMVFDVMGRAPLGKEWDHYNGNSLDNRRSNLRPATHTQNTRNVSLSTANTSGFKGVAMDRRRKCWQVGIKTGGIRRALGRFPFEKLEDAARCYDEEARKLFGEFAKLNFPGETSNATPSGW